MEEASESAVALSPSYRHPSGVQCIEIVRHMSFCLGNAVKYVWRGWWAPDLADTGDLEKAARHIREWLSMEVRPRMPMCHVVTRAVSRFATVDQEGRFSTIVRDLCRADFTHGNENAARHALGLIMAEIARRKNTNAA